MTEYERLVQRKIELDRIRKRKRIIFSIVGGVTTVGYRERGV